MVSGKRKRKLRFEHFDFDGADDASTPSEFASELLESDTKSGIESGPGPGSVPLDLDASVARHARSPQASDTVDADEVPTTESRAKYKQFGPVVWNTTNPRAQSVKWPSLLEHMSRTALQEASDDPTARFVCPLGFFGEILSSSSTLQDLWSHASDEFHQKELYRQGLVRCELGCPVGFTGALGRLQHYSQQACGVEMLQDYDCLYATCAEPSNETAYSRAQHWMHEHASEQYGSAGYAQLRLNLSPGIEIALEGVQESSLWRPHSLRKHCAFL